MYTLDTRKMELFAELGWTRRLNVENTEMGRMDEESRRQCEAFLDPSFQARWLDDVVRTSSLKCAQFSWILF